MRVLKTYLRIFCNVHIFCRLFYTTMSVYMYYYQTSQYPSYGVYVAKYGSVYAYSVYSPSGYRYLGDGGTGRCEILHDGRCWSQAIPKSEVFGVNFGHLTRISGKR